MQVNDTCNIKLLKRQQILYMEMTLTSTGSIFHFERPSAHGQLAPVVGGHESPVVEPFVRRIPGSSLQ